MGAKDERITVKSVVTLQLYNFLIARVPSARKFSRRNQVSSDDWRRHDRPSRFFDTAQTLACRLRTFNLPRVCTMNLFADPPSSLVRVRLVPCCELCQNLSMCKYSTYPEETTEPMDRPFLNVEFYTVCFPSPPRILPWTMIVPMIASSCLLSLARRIRLLSN